jgi:hypothetical protein
MYSIYKMFIKSHLAQCDGAGIFTRSVFFMKLAPRLDDWRNLTTTESYKTCIFHEIGPRDETNGETFCSLQLPRKL